MRKRTLITTRIAVDFSNTLYRMFFSQRGLTSDGVPSGGAYGMVTAIVSHMQMYKPKQLIVCKDSPPYIRKRMFPEYKGKRKPMDEETYSQIEQNILWASDLIESMGIHIWKQQGFEADDCMAAYAKKYAAQRHTKTIMVVNDSDMYQCFTKKNNVFLSVKNKLYGIHDFKQEYGIPVDKWPLHISLVGSHDDVPGIKGVGPVTATKAIQDPCKLRVLYDKHRDLIERNLKLAILPLPERQILIPKFERIEYDESKFVKALETVEIAPTGTMLDAVYDYHRG